MFGRTIMLSASPGAGVDLITPAASDRVAQALSAIQVRSSVYCLSELRAPWGFKVEGANLAKFHLVLEGACWLSLDDREPVRLAAGDLVILAGGEAHVMRDAPGSPVLGLDSIIADHPLDRSARLRYGGTGAATRLLCGGFQLDNPMALAACLPPILQLDSAGTGIGAWIEPVFALIRDEADRSAPGAEAVFAKLADVFLTQALRTYLIGAEQAGLLSGRPVPDAQVERAAELLGQQPARPWTLQALAREVGMSRSLLAARFRAATGESPMQRLAKVRLGQAAGYLTTASLGVEAIARRTGYASSASLSKAFKREFGVSPGRYRKLKGRVAELRVR
jgi:AraC-like DNA-binding protein